MTQNEKELFCALCRFHDPDADKLSLLLPENATASVLGHLFWNRVPAIAYGVLRDSGLLKKVPREFKNALHHAYLQNKERNQSYFQCLDLLSNLLEPLNLPYAMLKGALLCPLYPEGYRTSNDIDLLVRAGDISALGAALSAAGFRRGYIRGDRLEEATRREILESKMTRGETVPFVREVNLPFMRYLEVDINFSTDYKNGDADTMELFLKNTQKTSVAGHDIRTLDKIDFFIHLCCHLYKEAATLPWVRMGRDLTLYKFEDICFLLSHFTEKEIIALFSRAGELSLKEICACAILWTNDIFPGVSQKSLSMAKQALAGKEEMLNQVIDPAEQKIYSYREKDLFRRLFLPHRADDLL